MASAGTGMHGTVATSAASRARAPFADLPDRGDLVGYPQQRIVRRDGAYTWHRADVSEEHALRAIVDGELRITAPDGQLLAFEYERHVEHPTGDWTWIGRMRDAPPGRQAILTFGAEAVFGNIAQAVATPLRLTMRDGASWLVETDPALLAGVESRVLRPETPDFLLPPFHFGSLAETKAAGDTVNSSSSSVESSTSTSSPTATVVDVLVGYTSGFATAQGGDSPARTRINFLVDVANQGYINSQIASRVRLVHAMQVSYPDATDNGDTLEKLTGYKSGSGKTTPDPAFNALRDARETYGADLVTLVRKFSDPENNGCGIAWLIGGGLTTITQDYEYFGYSVVSDGQDQGDDGKTYYCRDETVAHEFAHNMGSAHDIETSKGDDGVLQTDEYGAYTYSFGYKTGPGSGDFYTIMAYPDQRDSSPYQKPYRVFSNPDITYCGGYPCGTSAADNARSLRQTMPIIASFRSTVLPAMRGDFDGDGYSDLLWRNDVSGSNAIWRSAKSSTLMSITAVTSLAWRIAAVGDFNADGKADIVWRNTSTGNNAIWWSGNRDTSDNLVTVTSQHWKIVGAGDFDGDGRSDLLWRNDSSGSNAIWRSANYHTPMAIAAVSNLSWRVAAVGDFNADGKSDIVWRNSSTGGNAIWWSGSRETSANLTTVTNQDWKIFSY